MAAAIVRLRAVGGRRHFASSYSSPCLMLPPDKMYSLRDKKVVNINTEKEFESDTDTVIGLGSSHGWMGLSKDRRSLSLWNPMSGSRIKLPPLHTIPNYSPKRMTKLVVDNAECSRAVMMSQSSNWLGVCCPDECSEWTLFGPDKDSFGDFYPVYHDVVACSRHRVYSLDECEGYQNLVRWDISDPRKPWKKRVYDPIYEDDFPRSGRPDAHHSDVADQHLVYAEHSDQIFIVTRHFWLDGDLRNYEINTKKSVAFDVHLLVENENENIENENNIIENETTLRYMEHSLDGLVMFVGHGNSFAISAADFPHLNTDSIYFTTNIINWNERNIYGGYDVGIYDYKNRTISSCYYPAGYHQPPSMALPHPFWLTPTSTSKG